MHPSVRVFLVLLVLFFVSLLARTGWIAHSQLEDARLSLKQGRPERALVHFERAVHAYLPLSGPANAAITGMRRLCLRLEKREPRLALEGWRRMRGALLASRHFLGQPHTRLLREADAHIAYLAASTDTQGFLSRAAIMEEGRRLLAAHPRDPSRMWVLLQFLFLALWIGASCRLIWLWPRRRLLLAAVAAGGWMAWLASLTLAG